MEPIEKYLASLKQAAQSNPKTYDELNSIISKLYLKVLPNPKHYLFYWKKYYEEPIKRIADQIHFIQPPPVILDQK